MLSWHIVYTRTQLCLHEHVINTTTHIGPLVLEIVELVLIHRNSHHTIPFDVIQMIS